MLEVLNLLLEHTRMMRKKIGYWMGNWATTFCCGVAKLAPQIGNLAPAQEYVKRNCSGAQVNEKC